MPLRIQAKTGLSEVLLAGAIGLKQATVVQAGLLVGVEVLETLIKAGFLGTTLPAVGGRTTKKYKHTLDKKGEGNGRQNRDIQFEVKTLEESFQANAMKHGMLEVHKCDAGGCCKKHELEYYLLDPGENISGTSFAENSLDEGGYRRFVLLDTHRGKDVADAARFFEAAKKVKPRSKDREEEVNWRQDAIMQLKRKDGLLEVKERTPK